MRGCSAHRRRWELNLPHKHRLHSERFTVDGTASEVCQRRAAQQCCQLCLLTTFVALPLLDLECEVKGANGEVDGLRVHSSNLAEGEKKKNKVTYYISKVLTQRDETDSITEPLTEWVSERDTGYAKESRGGNGRDGADTDRQPCTN